jgi:hypothetical protein
MNRYAIATASAALLALSTTSSAVTVIKMQTANAAGSFSLKYLEDNWVKKLEEMTYGNLKIDIQPSKSVVPHRETPQAVAAGILQGDNNAVASFAGIDPVFSMLGDLIAGNDTPAQKQMFFRFGGGVEVLQKAYDKFYPGKIHVVGAGPFSKEAFVSTVPIRNVADFKGLKLRSPEIWPPRCSAAPVPRQRRFLSPSCTPRLPRKSSMRPTQARTPTTARWASTRSPSSRSTPASTRWLCCSSLLTKLFGTKLARRVRQL